MAETTTVNFGWTMPDPGGSANTWGATLNATTQAIDAQVFANQQASNAGQSPVGSVTMFAGPTAPTGWLSVSRLSRSPPPEPMPRCSRSSATPSAARGANFNLPNFVGVFPTGASTHRGRNVGSPTATLAIANLPTHAHPITDVAHTHGASQPAHVHPDPGHTHGASQDAHAHGAVQQTNVGNYDSVHRQRMVRAGRDRRSAASGPIAAAAAGLGAAQPAITVTRFRQRLVDHSVRRGRNPVQHHAAFPRN